MSLLQSMVSRKHILLLLLIVLLDVTFVWLGLWQFDRLDQRKAANASLEAELGKPAQVLNGFDGVDGLIEGRAISAEGTFDFTHQFILVQQNSDYGSGVNLIAPYVLDDGTAVLVDRGWIELQGYEQLGPENYDADETMIEGVVRSADRQLRQAEITSTFTPEQFRLDTERLAAQLPYDLLPIIFAQDRAGIDPNLRPYRTEFAPDLTNGPHLGYALQWFSFAIIFTVGFIGYVWRDVKAG